MARVLSEYHTGGISSVTEQGQDMYFYYRNNLIAYNEVNGIRPNYYDILPQTTQNLSDIIGSLLSKSILKIRILV